MQQTRSLFLQVVNGREILIALNMDGRFQYERGRYTMWNRVNK